MRRGAQSGHALYIYIYFLRVPKVRLKRGVKGERSSDLLKRRSLVNFTKGIYKGALLKGRKGRGGGGEARACKLTMCSTFSEFSPGLPPFSHKHGEHIHRSLAPINQTSTAPLSHFPSPAAHRSEYINTRRGK